LAGVALFAAGESAVVFGEGPAHAIDATASAAAEILSKVITLA
jgi:hypothetical protein